MARIEYSCELPVLAPAHRPRLWMIIMDDGAIYYAYDESEDSACERAIEKHKNK